MCNCEGNVTIIANVDYSTMKAHSQEFIIQN